MFPLCRRAKAPWRQELCVGMSQESPWVGRGEQGWLLVWVTYRRGGDLLPARQHLPHPLPAHTALLHARAATQGRHFSGSGFSYPANLSSFKCKECHETAGIEHKAGVFTVTGNAMKLLALSIRLGLYRDRDYGTCISNLRKCTKILWNYFKYLMLDLAVLI